MNEGLNFEAMPFERYDGFRTPTSERSDFEAGVADFETTTRVAPGSKSVNVFALSRAIPNDPDYRKHVPLNYRLNAKKIVGEVAQDLSSRGESAHFWTDLVHWGIVGVEIFAEAGILAIASPILAAAASLMALGLPYLAAAEEIATNWSATGFSRGVVMGADGRRAKLVKEYFGSDYPPNYPFPRGRDIAIANYQMGLLVGYVQGRVLVPNQRAIFWRDLGRRMGDQSYRGPVARWARRDWIDWYVSSAAVFRRDHL